MPKRYYSFLFIIFLFIAFSIWILLPEIYFRIRYGVGYNEKSIFTDNKNKFSPLQIEQEINLQQPKQDASYLLPVPLADFKHAKGADIATSSDKLTLTPQGGRGLSYAQADVFLNDGYRKLVNQDNYSLSLSVLCDASYLNTAYITLIAGNKQIQSPLNAFGQDILTAVLPKGKNSLKSNNLRVRLVTESSGPVVFKNPCIVLTPLSPNLINKNYKERFNFRKTHKKRIIVIGGSIIYGTGSTINCTWPFILQQKLDYLYPNMFEVFNLGTWGGSIRDFIAGCDKIPWQRFEKTQYQANPEPSRHPERYKFGYKDLNPDIVILSVSWNDLTYDLANFYLRQPFPFGSSFFDIDQKLAPRLCKTAWGFYIYRALYRMITFILPLPSYISAEKIPGQFRGLDNYKLDYRSLFPQHAEEIQSFDRDFQRNLSALIGRLKSSYNDVKLIIPPSLVYSRENDYKDIKRFGLSERFFLFNYWCYGLGGIMERASIRRVAELTDVEVCDLSLAFSNENSRKRNALFTDFIHLTDLGNNYMGTRLLFYLMPQIRKELSDG